MTIEFKAVRIWRSISGKLVGNVDFAGKYGETRLNLTEELCTSILAICADNIVGAASEIAEHMKSEAAQIEVVSGKAIESGEEHQ